MNEVLPPMVKCSECVYAFKYYDNILGKSRYACSIMQEIGEFDDFYAIVDSGCVYGIKKSAETAISADNGSNQTAWNDS